MITCCESCGQLIRDCTGFSYVNGECFPVIDWYHIDTGDEWCRGIRALAWPVLQVDVTCREHPHAPDEKCDVCEIASQVSLLFHNKGRCIEQLCGWLHVQ